MAKATPERRRPPHRRTRSSIARAIINLSIMDRAPGATECDSLTHIFLRQLGPRLHRERNASTIRAAMGRSVDGLTARPRFIFLHARGGIVTTVPHERRPASGGIVTHLACAASRGLVGCRRGGDQSRGTGSSESAASSPAPLPRGNERDPTGRRDDPAGARLAARRVWVAQPSRRDRPLRGARRRRRRGPAGAGPTRARSAGGVVASARAAEKGCYFDGGARLRRHARGHRFPPRGRSPAVRPRGECCDDGGVLGRRSAYRRAGTARSRARRIR